MAVTRIQVEQQLERILESKALSRAEKVRDLLRHVVTGTLDGIPQTQTSLLIDFFLRTTEQAQDPSRDEARIWMGRVRGKLNIYYASEGIDDTVLIEIPLGSYDAQFKQNPLSPDQKQVHLGFQHVNEETPEHVRQALAHFENALTLNPTNADAWAGKASAYLTMTLHAYGQDPEELFVDAENAARKAIDIDKSCWRGHANLGAVYLFRHEWEAADAAFQTAKKLSASNIYEIGGYGPYLVAAGRSAEARELAQHYISVGYDNAVLLTRAGLYLYALREFDWAKDVLLDACQRSPNFWRSHLVLAFVYLSLNEPKLGLEQMNEVEYWARMNLWPGMKVLCLEATGDSEGAEHAYATLLASSKEHYVQPMQLALGCIALGDNEQAISFLSSACDAHDPFTAWLRFWPLLDPLRMFPAFRGLLRKWNFPQG